jgi:hypothetical protein
VRKNQAPGDYKNPGWYQQPPGTQAYEWTGTPLPVKRESSAGSSAMPRESTQEIEVKAKKPGHSHQH